MKQAEKNKLSKEKILNAAIHDFNESNSQDISINRICKQNNISKGLLYHYYKSKEDLFYSCICYATRKLTDDINSFEVNKNCDIEKNLHLFYEERIEYWCLHPDDYTMTRNAINNYYACNDTSIEIARQIYEEANNNKLLEILNECKIKFSVSTENLLYIIQVIYENMFLNSMDKIVYAVKEKNFALAKKQSEELLTLYDGLINILIFGIINKNDNTSD